MRVLVGCETSGRVREAFRALGHEAWSCDLLPADDASPFHKQCSLQELMDEDSEWDLGIFHPPCTYLSSSGLHWNTRDPERRAKTDLALSFVKWIMKLPIYRKAIENPIGCISSRIRKPEQIIHPHQFGHDASKATCLWLENLPKLLPTEHVPPRMVNGLPRWANQTDSGQNRLPPSDDRWKIRSETYQGIADAMAAQWGRL